MPILTTCTTCGKAAKAPDSAAGKKARCTGCGGIVQIPAAVAAPTKICAACNIDVSGIKRTKDTEGRYYCGPCWQAKVEAGEAANLEEVQPVVSKSVARAPVVSPSIRSPLTAAAPAMERMATASVSQPVRAGVASSVSASAPPPAPPAEEEDDGVFMRFRDEPEPERRPVPPVARPIAQTSRPIPALKSDDDVLDTLEECRECGVSFPAADLVPGDGDGVVCEACARKELSVGPPALPAIPAYQPPQYAPSQYAPQPARVLPYKTPTKQKARMSYGGGGNHVRQMVVGGIICGIGIVVTVGSFLASMSGHGGSYVVAWGAIIFGGIRFFRGLAGAMSGG